MTIYDLKVILNAFWFRTIIFFILGFAIAYHFLKYKKGVKVSLYYGRGFLFILVAYIILIYQASLKRGSPLDIITAIILFCFLILGMYNITYLTSKNKLKKQNTP